MAGDGALAQPSSEASKSDASDPAYVETGVADVTLADARSGEQFLETNGPGTTSDDGLFHNFYSNGPGSEILDLVRHPGGVRHSFSEAIMFLSDWFPLGAPRTKDDVFVSSKGIRLGLSPSEVRRALGRPHKVKAEKSGKLTYKYFCDDPVKCPSLAKLNMPTYSATAVFLRGRLVHYSFGYDYP
jgi:hypothetical protein